MLLGYNVQCYKHDIQCVFFSAQNVGPKTSASNTFRSLQNQRQSTAET